MKMMDPHHLKIKTLFKTLTGQITPNLPLRNRRQVTVGIAPMPPTRRETGRLLEAQGLGSGARFLGLLDGSTTTSGKLLNACTSHFLILKRGVRVAFPSRCHCEDSALKCSAKGLEFGKPSLSAIIIMGG